MNDEDEGWNKQLIDVALGGKVIEDNEDKSNKLIDVVSSFTLATYNRDIAIREPQKPSPPPSFCGTSQFCYGLTSRTFVFCDRNPVTSVSLVAVL